MSTNPTSQPPNPNPYQASVWPGTVRRPGWLTAVCVIAIILAGLGLLTSITSTFSLAIGTERVQQWTQSMTPPMPNPKMKELQDELNNEIWTATRNWLGYSCVMLVCLVVFSVLLLTGAIKTLGLRPAGRTLLMGVLVAGIVLEIMRAVPQTAIALKMQAAMKQYTEKIMESAAPPGKPLPPGMGQMMSGIMSASMAFGMFVSAVWLALKIGFYFFGAIYLRRPAIRALFAVRMPT